ncbi:hypothetical protein O181_035051 [Austropuccinia psidii MF-1]|uniref:Uncharacterized protein n=1 Tax=Austropuccinia psidii MF-1 TaxID=1389203 RepID=A0A9Q3D7J8_9BASI|nr:hypothetical protein [Austropuccinia psidii MF-1]
MQAFFLAVVPFILICLRSVISAPYTPAEKVAFGILSVTPDVTSDQHDPTALGRSLVIQIEWDEGEGDECNEDQDESTSSDGEDSAPYGRSSNSYENVHSQGWSAGVFSDENLFPKNAARFQEERPTKSYPCADFSPCNNSDYSEGDVTLKADYQKKS